MQCKSPMTKQLCFINLETNQQNTVYAKLPSLNGELDLSSVLADFNSLHPLNRKRHFTVDPAGMRPLLKFDLLPKDLIQNDPLILYYKEEQLAETSETDQNGKKERNKERTIREVIESIRKWRSFHKVRIEGAKVSLLQAAEFIGISKKSLDDYFCQLRLGEKYGFAFMDHLDEKIGVLRAYVKKFRPKQQRSQKNEKHPKTLQILEIFQQIQDTKPIPSTPPKQSMPIQFPSESTSPKEEPEEDISMTPMDRQQTSEFQNQFFHLDMILNEPTDPFVQYQPRDYREFKNKDYGVGNPIDFEDEGVLDISSFMW